jgi:hypothetical protein
MGRLHMRSLLYLLKEKQKHIGVSFESVSPTLIQLFLSWKTKPRRFRCGRSTEKSGEGKNASYPRLTYATGRNHSLDGEEKRVEGKW